jgi:hypothetical protein
VITTLPTIRPRQEHCTVESLRYLVTSVILIVLTTANVTTAVSFLFFLFPSTVPFDFLCSVLFWKPHPHTLTQTHIRTHTHPPSPSLHTHTNTYPNNFPDYKVVSRRLPTACDLHGVEKIPHAKGEYRDDPPFQQCRLCHACRQHLLLFLRRFDPAHPSCTVSDHPNNGEFPDASGGVGVRSTRSTNIFPAITSPLPSAPHPPLPSPLLSPLPPYLLPPLLSALL